MKMDFNIRIVFESNNNNEHCFFTVDFSQSVKTIIDLLKFISKSDRFNGSLFFKDKTINIGSAKSQEEVQQEAEMDSMAHPLP